MRSKNASLTQTMIGGDMESGLIETHTGNLSHGEFHKLLSFCCCTDLQSTNRRSGIAKRVGEISKRAKKGKCCLTSTSTEAATLECSTDSSKEDEERGPPDEEDEEDEEDEKECE